MKKKIASLVCLFACATMLVGCEQPIPPEALQLSPESIKTRQIQTRKFRSQEEKRLLSASMEVLQDLGYQLSESETKLGVIVAHKKADAMESGQVAAAVVVAVLFGAVPAIDNDQVIYASLVTTPSSVTKQSALVRIVFHREVTNTHNQICRREQIEDPKIYQRFFSKLSKSVFLEANNI